MGTTTRKVLREGYNRLKKTLEKIIKQNKEQAQPQLVLQPIRNRPSGPQDSVNRPGKNI